MLDKFLLYINTEISLRKEDKTLLAVSGGVDSMVLLDLLHRGGYSIEVAHIDHNTREGGSLVDAEFVRKTCADRHIPFHLLTLNYKELSVGNFQQNARDSRYSFLYSVADKINAKHIATAHHQNDRWETFVMHLNRKSGIQGLTSLRTKDTMLIRPLMGVTKKDILSYANQHSIDFREDGTNATDAYTRNKIRHHITSATENIFPNFIPNVNQSIQHLEQTERLLAELVAQLNLVTNDGAYTIIDLKKIRTFSQREALLFYIVSAHGHSLSDVQDMIKCTSTGALFPSTNYEILYDRERLILRKKQVKKDIQISVNKLGSVNLSDGRKLKVEIVSPQLTNPLCLYRDVLEEKVMIRSVKEGDIFCPVGLNGKKKTLKKFMNDHRLHRFQRENQLVVEVNGIIAQVIGLRSAHGFQPKKDEQSVLLTII